MRRYRSRVVFGPFTPVEPDEIRALESEIGQALPSGYSDFVHTINGGTLDYAIRMPSSAGGESLAFTDIYPPGRDRDGGYGYIEEESAKSAWTAMATDPANPWRRVTEDWLDDGLPDWRTRRWAQRG